MKKRRYFLVLSLGLVFTSFAQKDLRQDLIVAHVDAASKTQFTQKLYAYHFLNGSYTGRDEIITVAGKKEGKDYIRFDRGYNRIYKNRYLITGIGNIIDLQEKKVLFDGKAKLMRCSNDSAIFYTDDIFKGRFYSVYNFSNHSYGEVKDLLFKTQYGRDVEYDKSSKPFQLLYFPKSKPRVLLSNDAGFGQAKQGESYVPDPPLVWIDNDNFMYCHFNASNTEVQFVTVNVESKKSKVIGSLDIRNEIGYAELEKISSEQVIFKLGSKYAFLDLEAGSMEEQSYTRPSYGFSFVCKADPKTGRAISLYGKAAGTFHFEPQNFVSSENIAALVKEMKIGQERYQQGLAVWNHSRQKWEMVDAEEVLCLLGWLNF